MLSCQIAFQRLVPYIPFLIIDMPPFPPLNHLHKITVFHRLLLSFQNLQIHLPRRALFIMIIDLRPKPPLRGFFISFQFTKWSFLLDSSSPHRKFLCMASSLFAILVGMLFIRVSLPLLRAIFSSNLIAYSGEYR